MWLLNIIISVIPVIILLIYFYTRDKYKNEPFGLVLIAFGLGILMVVMVLLIGTAINYPLSFIKSKYLHAFLTSLIQVAFVGEFLKFLIIRFFIFKRKHFDEIVDGIVYTVTTSLGFAVAENILYSIDSTETAILRAITAVPGHAIWSGLMGYYIGLAKFRPHKRKLLFFVGLLISIALHTAYSFFIFSETILALLIVPLLFFGFILLKFHIKLAMKKDIESGRL